MITAVTGDGSAGQASTAGAWSAKAPGHKLLAADGGAVCRTGDSVSGYHSDSALGGGPGMSEASKGRTGRALSLGAALTLGAAFCGRAGWTGAALTEGATCNPGLKQPPGSSQGNDFSGRSGSPPALARIR